MGDYDTDLLLWSEHQADLLRRMAAGERVNDRVDWENVAEEIESLGRSDKRELRSRVQNILLHLIKLQISPAAEPCPGWRRTIIHERVRTEMLIEESPSLGTLLPGVVEEELSRVRKLAVEDLAAYGERPAIDPAGLSFTAEQVLGSWLPD